MFVPVPAALLRRPEGTIGLTGGFGPVNDALGDLADSPEGTIGLAGGFGVYRITEDGAADIRKEPLDWPEPSGSLSA